MGVVKIVSTLPEFEGCFVDVEDIWTRPERAEYLAANDAQTFDIIRRRVTACHLLLVDGTFCDDPKALTEATIDHMDVRLVAFLSGALNAAYSHVSSLGFRSARPSSVGTAATAKND